VIFDHPKTDFLPGLKGCI